MTRSRRPVALPLAAIGLAVLFALPLGAGTASASAAGAGGGDSVLVSRDGITYSSSLEGGLFDGAGGLVPGQSIGRELWVRNPTASAAALRVSIRNLVTGSAAFGAGVSLAVVDSLPGSVPVSTILSGFAPCQVIVAAPSIPAGGTVTITLTFSMADGTPAILQTDRAYVDLMVAMRDASAGPFTGSPCGDGGILLADTGVFRPVPIIEGPLPVVPIIGGGLLLGVAIFLLVARRRRESRDD